MSKSEIEPESIVGDDGELLEADTSFPRVKFVEVPLEPIQPPVGIRVGKWLFYGIAAAVFGVCSIWWLTLPIKRSTYTYEYERPIPTSLPAATSFPNYPSYFVENLQPPITGMMLKWDGHLTGIRDLSWSSDQSQLAIIYGQKLLLAIWNIKEGEYTVKQSDITAFDWSPQNARQFVAANDQTIDIYESGATLADITTLKVPPDFTLPASLVRWSMKGSHIAALSQDGKTLAIFQDTTGELQIEKYFEQPVTDMRWSPVKPLLLVVQPKTLFYLQPADSVFAQPQQEWTTTLEDKVSWKMASFAPDGKQLALSGHDCDAHLAVFDMLQTSPIWVKRVGNYEPQLCSKDSQTRIAWSPTSNRIAGFIQGDDTVYVWDSTTQIIVDRLTPESGRYIASIAWSLDGRYLTACTNSTVVQWSPS